MSDRADQLKPALAALDSEDRAELAKFLLESLDPPGDEVESEEWHAAWTAELNRRWAEVENGTAKLIPVEDVMKAMREKYP